MSTASLIGLFSKRQTTCSLVKKDAAGTDLQGASGNDSSTDIGKFTRESRSQYQTRKLRPSEDSEEAKLERLLELIGQAFVASWQETLLEQITLLLEKNPKLIENLKKTQKLNQLDIANKWGLTPKIADLLYRLETLGLKLTKEHDPKLQKNLIFLDEMRPRHFPS